MHASINYSVGQTIIFCQSDCSFGCLSVSTATVCLPVYIIVCQSVWLLCLFVCLLFIYLFVYLCLYPFNCSFACLSVRLSVCLSICTPVSLFDFLSVCLLFVHLFVYFSLCPFECPFVCLFVRLLARLPGCPYPYQPVCCLIFSFFCLAAPCQLGVLHCLSVCLFLFSPHFVHLSVYLCPLLFIPFAWLSVGLPACLLAFLFVPLFSAGLLLC